MIGAIEAPCPVLRAELDRALAQNSSPADKDTGSFCGGRACIRPRSSDRNRAYSERRVHRPRVHHRELHRSGDEAAWWRRLNIDPLPVALRLWRHTRLSGELALAGEGIMQLQAAKIPDISAQDRGGTSRDPRANSESAGSKNADGGASG